MGQCSGKTLKIEVFFFFFLLKWLGLGTKEVSYDVRRNTPIKFMNFFDFLKVFTYSNV